VRTERDAAATLDRLQPARVVRGVLRLVPFLLLPLLIQGFLAIEIRQGFEGSVEVQRAAEYWRSNVATWKDFVPPEITRIDLRLDLEPSERRMSVAGSYALVNDTQEPMRWLPFTIGSSFGPVVWSLPAQHSQSRAGRVSTFSLCRRRSRRAPPAARFRLRRHLSARLHAQRRRRTLSCRRVSCSRRTGASSCR
jgi:hypothetical protein